VILDEGTEHRGLLYDMSPGGLSLTSEIGPPRDSRVVIYIEDIGRVEGIAARPHEFGFAVRLTPTQVRWDKLANA
jgi:hypothetical protein